MHSPLHRALAVWGLTGDDIGALSIHGTSTKANASQVITSHHSSFVGLLTPPQDKNETQIWDDILLVPLASHKFCSR